MTQIADILPALVALCRDIHAHPELGLREHRTAGRIADELRKLGIDVHEGIGTTGLVGVLQGKREGTRSVGLRADMVALPIHEATNLPWASKTPGTFHGCGHHGHVAMLLGVARGLPHSN